MRGVGLAAGFLLFFGACTVSIEGAPCQGDGNCPSGQRCGYDRTCSKAAAGCTGPICHEDECNGKDALKCGPVGAGICAELTIKKNCLPPRVCGIVDGVSDCYCSPSDCTAVGTQCNVARTKILTCDIADGCWYATTTTDCATDEVCGDAAPACVKSYVVEITAPSAGAAVGPAGAAVTAKVTLGSSAITAPASLGLQVDGAPVAGVLLTKTGLSGGVATYSGTWTPASGVDASQALTAVATATFGSVVSPPVSVDVDTTAPVVSATAGCTATPCLRDDDLTVSASVDDRHMGAGALVEVSLDLDGNTIRRPLAFVAGTSWSATLKLADWPFPRFGGTVTAQVAATDARGNAAPLAAAPAVAMTRHRWSYAPSPGAPVTSPAVLPDGTAVVGLATTSNQLRLVNVNGSEGWKHTLEALAGQGQPVTSAPSAEIDVPGGGKQAVWAASDDGRLYPRFADGTVPAAPVCPGGGAVSSNPLFTPAIAQPFSTLALDTVYSAGTQSRLRRGEQDGTCDSPGTSTTDPTTTSTSLAMVGGLPKVFMATAPPVTGASLRRFGDDGVTTNFEAALSLTDGAASPSTCDVVAVPLAMDGSGNVLAACKNGQVHRVPPDFTASTTGTWVTTLAFEPSESIALLPGGDLLVPGKDGKLHRLSPAGIEAWAANLKSSVGGVAVVAPDAAAVVAYAVTSGGHLWALNSSGLPVWSTDAVATPLGSGPLGFPTVAPAQPGRLPTLLVGEGSATGAVHAVVVDSGLDTGSPWPKSHRDLRNTGNWAAPQP